MSASGKAELYRMVTDDHICPFGLKAKDLLQRKGLQVVDHRLTSRRETERFMREVQVETTPQIYIAGRRIGGYDELREYFGLEAENDNEDETTYRPVIAVFASAALMALAGSWATLGDVATLRSLEWFIAMAMCILAVLKLRDLEGFSNQFLGYDLLAQRVVRYAYVYPFAELFAGLGMIAGLAVWAVAPVALFIGSVGAVSVFKAVYVDKRELKCACVGGASNVPLGFVSLTENLMMVAMAVWMTVKALAFPGL